MGDALLFWSLDSRLEEDVNALHAGAPVLRGVKVRDIIGIVLAVVDSDTMTPNA